MRSPEFTQEFKDEAVWATDPANHSKSATYRHRKHGPSRPANSSQIENWLAGWDGEGNLIS
jgi:hypothetical protein